MKAGGQQAGKGSKSTKAAETHHKKPLTMFWLRSCRSLKPRWSGDGNRMCAIAGAWLRWPQSHSATGNNDRKGGAGNLGPISPPAQMSIYIWISVFLNVLMCEWGPLFGSSLEWKVPALFWWWCQTGATPEPLNWLKYAAAGTGCWESGSTRRPGNAKMWPKSSFLPQGWLSSP